MDINDLRDEWNLLFESAQAFDPRRILDWRSVLWGWLIGKGVPHSYAYDVVLASGSNGWEVGDEKRLLTRDHEPRIGSASDNDPWPDQENCNG